MNTISITILVILTLLSLVYGIAMVYPIIKDNNKKKNTVRNILKNKLEKDSSLFSGKDQAFYDFSSSSISSITDIDFSQKGLYDPNDSIVNSH